MEWETQCDVLMSTRCNTRGPPFMYSHGECPIYIGKRRILPSELLRLCAPHSQWSVYRTADSPRLLIARRAFTTHPLDNAYAAPFDEHLLLLQHALSEVQHTTDLIAQEVHWSADIQYRMLRSSFYNPRSGVSGLKSLKSSL